MARNIKEVVPLKSVSRLNHGGNSLAEPTTSSLEACLEVRPENHDQASFEWMRAFDQIDDPVFVHDKDFRILRCNKAYARCAGLPMHAIIGTPYWQLFPKTSAPLQHCVKALGSPVNGIHSESISATGEIFLTRDISAYRDSGEFWYSQHIVQNITAHRQLDGEQKLKSAFSEAIIGSAPGVFVVVDQQHRLVRWNEDLNALTGKSDAELENSSFLSLLPELNREEMAAKLREAFASGQARAEITFNCTGQRSIAFSVSARRFEVGGESYVVSFFMDQSSKKELENALMREKTIYESIIESTPGAFFMIDEQGIMIRWNDQLRVETGLSDDQLRGMSFLETIHPDDRAFAAAKILTVFATGYAQMEVRVPNVQRGTRIYLKSARRFYIDDQPYAAGFCFDLTDRKKTEEALVNEKVFSDALIESMPGSFYVVDHECNYFRWNSYLNRLTGLADNELHGRPTLLSIEANDRTLAAATMKKAFECGCAQADLHIITRDRGVRLFSVTVRRFSVGGATYLVGVGIDTTEWLDKVTRLEHEAQTDALTQITNRSHFLHMAQQEFARCRRYNHPVSLWMLDIDHFKAINDTYGHPAGDIALQSLVATSRDALRNWDIFGRVGGEEFAVLLPETESAQALLVAERLRQAIAMAAVPIGEGPPVYLTVSIGIATAQDDDADVISLLERADRLSMSQNEQDATK